MSEIHDLGFQTVQEKPYCHSTTFNDLQEIKQQCQQDTLILVGGKKTDSDKILLCCIYYAQDALQETNSSKLANKTNKGNYFHFKNGRSFGFSPNQTINLDYKDTVDVNERLSLYLSYEFSGSRIGNQVISYLQGDEYTKIILLKK